MNGTDEGINKFDLASGTESYHFEIRATTETISIFVKDNNPCIIPVPSFEISYTLEDFNQLSKDFKKCDSILEAKEFIIVLVLQRLRKNKNEIAFRTFLGIYENSISIPMYQLIKQTK